MFIDHVIGMEIERNTEDQGIQILKNPRNKVFSAGKKPPRFNTANWPHRKLKNQINPLKLPEGVEGLGEQTTKTINNLLKKTHSQIGLLQKRLEDCAGENGIIDPSKVINALNDVQRLEDPDAYVPDIVIQHRKKEEEKKLEDLLTQHYA